MAFIAYAPVAIITRAKMTPVVMVCLITDPVVPSTIPSQCCAIPFTLNGAVHYSCVDDGGGVGCFYGNRQWKLCQQPAGKTNIRLCVNV